MTRYTYTIDENNAVFIFDNENLNEDESANIFQPGITGSTSLPFESRVVAENWAQDRIEKLLNPLVLSEPVASYVPPVDSETTEE